MAVLERNGLKPIRPISRVMVDTGSTVVRGHREARGRRTQPQDERVSALRSRTSWAAPRGTARPFIIELRTRDARFTAAGGYAPAAFCPTINSVRIGRRNSPSASRVTLSAASDSAGVLASRSRMARVASGPEWPNSHHRPPVRPAGNSRQRVSQTFTIRPLSVNISCHRVAV